MRITATNPTRGQVSFVYTEAEEVDRTAVVVLEAA